MGSVELVDLAAEQTRAMRLASALAARRDVTGVAIFGSYARGTAIIEQSDVDLLVVLGEGQATPAVLAAELPDELRGDDVSISVFTPASLRNYLHHWSRFALHLQREAAIVYDPDAELYEIFDHRRSLSLDYEICMQKKRLSQLEHMERFGDRMVLPLAQLYRLGRTLVFVILAQRGQLEFDRHTAFAQLKDLDRVLAADVDLVERLAPFYVQWRGLNAETTTPFDPVGPDAIDQAIRAREAVRSLMDAAESCAGVQ